MRTKEAFFAMETNYKPNVSNVLPFKEKERENENENENEKENEKESTNPTSSLSDNSGKAAIGISDTANSQKEAAAGPIFSFWQSEDATMQG